MIYNFYTIKSTEGVEVYVGFTIHDELERWSGHLRNYGLFKRGKAKSCGTVCVIFDKYGWKTCILTFIESGEYATVREARRRESEIIKATPNCVNFIRDGGLTEEEKAEKKKQQDKDYYETHKEERQGYIKEWTEKNKEEVAQKKKEKYLANKEEIRERQRIKRLENKEKVNARRKELRQANKEAAKAHYEANKDEINRKKREWRLRKKQGKSE
jgi:hypothetical protein